MSFIYTYTGRRFDPLNPDPEQVDIQDIAHALSNMCRYTGHCSDFYSVAQHAVTMSAMVPSRLRFLALMHDAAEAYMADMPRPLKHIDGFAQLYREAEVRLLDVILPVFGIDPAALEEIEQYDQFMLAWEQRDLMPASLTDGAWYPRFSLPKTTLTSWSPRAAKRVFLRRFDELSEGQLALTVPTEAA